MFTVGKDAEVKLVESLGTVKEDASSWRAVHFHFSQLLEHYRSDYQLKIAVNMINDLLKTYQGWIFVCSDSNIFLLCRGVTKSQLDKVIFQLRYLFMDDPLSYTQDGSENEDFCRMFDLGVSYDDLLEISRKKMAFAGRAGKARAIARGKDDNNKPLPRPGGKFFDPSLLAVVERDLTNADLSKVMRRQPICAAVPSMMIRRVFDELYINIKHLQQLLHVDVDLLSNRWLFKYLTQILDERMLHTLRNNHARFLDAPASINMNVQTVLSKQFADLDAVLKPEMKVSIVLEIQVADIFADMAAFVAARQHAQKLGYRVCLDGLTSLSFTQISRERLGFDLAKLQWNADIEGDLKSAENKKVAEAIKQCGPNRVILCRCDSRQAIDYGQAMGISLFQGRYLDMIMNPTSKIEN